MRHGTKRIISLIIGILILLGLLITFWATTQPVLGGPRGAYYWRIFVMLIAVSIISVLGFELIRIGLKSET